MFNYTRANLRRLIRWLLLLEDTPHDIALGAAVGIFITFTPVVGLHMAIVVALSLVIRMNRTAALAAVWVNNPLTIIPVFFFNYLIGALVLLHEPMTWHGFRETFQAAFVHETWYQNLGAMFIALGRITLEIAVPLWVGSLLVATALSVPAYFIVRRLAEKYQARKGAAEAACDEGPLEGSPGPEGEALDEPR